MPRGLADRRASFFSSSRVCVLLFRGARDDAPKRRDSLKGTPSDLKKTSIDCERDKRRRRRQDFAVVRKIVFFLFYFLRVSCWLCGRRLLPCVPFSFFFCHSFMAPMVAREKKVEAAVFLWRIWSCRSLFIFSLLLLSCCRASERLFFFVHGQNIRSSTHGPAPSLTDRPTRPKEEDECEETCSQKKRYRLCRREVTSVKKKDKEKMAQVRESLGVRPHKRDGADFVERCSFFCLFLLLGAAKRPF